LQAVLTRARVTRKSQCNRVWGGWQGLLSGY